MVEDGQIALTIIEGTLVAMPLWLAVVSFTADDLERVKKNDDLRWIDRSGWIVLAGLVTGIGFLSLLFSFIFSATVAVGLGDYLTEALIAVGVFIFVVGYQVTMGLVNRVASNFGHRGELLAVIGLAGGVTMAAWLYSFI